MPFEHAAASHRNPSATLLRRFEPAKASGPLTPCYHRPTSLPHGCRRHGPADTTPPMRRDPVLVDTNRAKSRLAGPRRRAAALETFSHGRLATYGPVTEDRSHAAARRNRGINRPGPSRSFRARRSTASITHHAADKGSSKSPRSSPDRGVALRPGSVTRAGIRHGRPCAAGGGRLAHKTRTRRQHRKNSGQSFRRPHQQRLRSPRNRGRVPTVQKEGRRYGRDLDGPEAIRRRQSLYQRQVRSRPPRVGPRHQPTETASRRLERMCSYHAASRRLSGRYPGRFDTDAEGPRIDSQRPLSA
jgi:hypothetical protein